MIQIKKTILTLVALLAVTTGAWAQGVLNIVVDGTSATIKYDGNASNNPYFGGDEWKQEVGPWDNEYTTRPTITTVTIDGSCKNFSGTSLRSLFIGFSGLTTINGLDNLNTANVQDMEYMFADCSSLTSLDLSSFNTASLTTMSNMFAYCSKLTTVDLSGWNTENVEMISSLFFNCSELTTVDLSSWNTAKVWNTGYMFYNCSKLENIYVGDGWSTAKVDQSDDMFSGCTKLLSMNTANPATNKTNAHTGDGGYLKVKPAGTPVDGFAWDDAKKTGTFKMPGGNVTLEPEYYPQAALTAAPTAINDVPATTDGAIVKAGTVANIGSTETAQGTVMYYVSKTELDDAALLALAADQWTADVPTAKSLAKGQAYVYYYVRGNDSNNDEENFSDGDILAANALTVTIAAEPTKVTMAVNDKAMGTAEVAGQSKVEWTADTWKGWTQNTKEYTVDDITMTSSESGHIREYISEDKYNNSLFFFVRKQVNDATVTFSTTGDPFSRIEFTMIGDYSQYNPDIIPNDNWTFEGKSAVWEGEATKSLTLQSCSTNVSKITFYKGAIPDGVTINGDGTFTVAKTATVTLKATPAEGYKFLYWEDDQTNTNPVREVTIESGMADKTYKAVFAEITYNVTFVEGTNLDEWTATPNTEVKKDTKVDIKYNGTKKVIGVTVEKKEAVDPAKAYLKWDADQKKLVATEIPAEATKVENSDSYVEWSGTYVVEGNVTITGNITLSGNVNLIIKDGATLNAKKIIGYNNNLSIYGQANQTGQLVVDNSGDDAITSMKTLEVHSAKLTATSSYSDRGALCYIGTFNVYGGSVDAKNTGSKGGYGIWLGGNGPMNIYGGEVKAVGKGNGGYSYGITANSATTVTVYGGKLWAENADQKALNSNVTLTKGAGFTGTIKSSSDKLVWFDGVDADAKYVKAE